MKKFKNHTLTDYLSALSKKTPTPGGGSVAAYTGALGVGLILMVAQYSKGRSKNKSIEDKIKKIIKEAERFKKRLLELVDVDAEAYNQIVKARKGTDKQKQKAFNQANKVSLETCRLCYKSIQMTPFLVKKGSPYMISDIEVAVEVLLASYNSAMAMLEVNQ